MKKTLLLSVVASTMIMAGGDIAPVEPVVEAPAVEASGWDFSGQAVVYYQTNDDWNDKDGSLFDQDNSAADAGLQLRAVNKDVFAGVGMGFEVNALSTLNLENAVVDNVMQGVGNGDLNDMTDGGWLSQAYLTYAMGNTSFKLGRQELPKALSPFAFSEGWNVFKNTFDAVLVVNTDITDTTLVGAWVAGANHNGFGAGNDLSDFNSLNEDKGVYMLTAQNKSISDLTLTGTWYYANTDNDLNILWADAKYNAGSFNVALQGGTIMTDALADDAVAFGAKIGADFDMFNASLAYSSTDDNAAFRNLGGVKTPLYTQMVLNQDYIGQDSKTIVARVGIEALGGNFNLAYGYSDIDLLPSGEYKEFDLTYKTKVLDNSTTLFAGYVYKNDGCTSCENEYENMLRVWGRYNF